MTTAIATPTDSSVRVGTIMGMGSAVFYTLANLGLRQVASSSDVGWAIWMSAVKCVPVTVIVWAIIGWKCSRGEQALPSRKSVLPLLAAGLVMQFGGNVLFQWAISFAGLAITVPMMFACIIGSGAYLAKRFLGDPISKRTLQAMLVLVVAIFLLSAGVSRATDGGTTEMSKSGYAVAAAILAAVVAGCTYGMTGVIIRSMVVRGVPAVASMVMFCSSGVVVLGTIGYQQLGAERILATPASDWTAILFAGTCNAVGFFCFTGALRRIPVNRTNLLNASQVAMCAVAGVLVFSEPVTGVLVLGCVLTIVGIMLVDNEKQDD